MNQNFEKYSNEKVFIDQDSDFEYCKDRFRNTIEVDTSLLGKRDEGDFGDDWDDNEELFNYLKKYFVV